MAVEREIKLALRPRDAAALSRHPLLVASPSTTERVESRYFDTAERTLSQAGIAVRIRRAGKRYLATIKSEGNDASGLTERHEWEVALPSLVARPLLRDPQPLFGAGALAPLLDAVDEEAIRRILQTTLATWQPLLATSFRRTSWRVPLTEGEAEVVLDRGRIVASTGTLPLCELELESATASAATLYGLARQLAEQVPLWPEPRSKAARGLALLEGKAYSPVKAAPPLWSRKMSVAEAFWLAWSETVAQGGSNLSLYLATHDPEALHQLRVALRRARVLLRLFAPWLGKTQAKAWQAELGELARALGAARDRDVLLTELIEPTLTHCPVAPKAVAALRDRLHTHHRPPPPPYAALGRFWLEVAHTLSQSERIADPSVRLRPFLAKRMERFRQRVVHCIAAWEAEPTAANRHRVRVALKAWRYALEWCQALLPRRSGAKHLVRAKRALDLLGAAQDWESAAVALSPFLRRNDPSAVGAATVLAWHHARVIPAADNVLASLAEWLADPIGKEIADDD